jgi:YD repeat-containing protein
MLRTGLIFIAVALACPVAHGCGLDWTLPFSHFDGINEEGYVEYWEKIGQVDLGDGLVIPVNISFNSRQEASSPTLGKGWIVALLESHVEPVDDNAMKVIMPDGWTFTFLRNGNADTWRGNAGWVGETNDTIFTIKAPCGTTIKYDKGKIQEIDTIKNKTLTYKYNGQMASEVDVNGKAFLQVESNDATGVVEDLVVDGLKINVAFGQRPRILNRLNQNMIIGFDSSLSQLQWADGKEEAFAFTTDKNLDPMLVISNSDKTQRHFTWDANTRQIKTDDGWTYNWHATDPAVTQRTDAEGHLELYSQTAGTTIEQGFDGVRRITTKFVNAGPLNGKIRAITETKDGVKIPIYVANYDEEGRLIREISNSGVTATYQYDASGSIRKTIKLNNVDYEVDYNAVGKIIRQSSSLDEPVAMGR